MLCTCAHAHASSSGGSSSAALATASTGRSAPDLETIRFEPSSRTTTSAIQGTSLPSVPGAAGVNIHGRSGVTSSSGDEVVLLEVAHPVGGVRARRPDRRPGRPRRRGRARGSTARPGRSRPPPSRRRPPRRRPRPPPPSWAHRRPPRWRGSAPARAASTGGSTAFRGRSYRHLPLVARHHHGAVSAAPSSAPRASNHPSRGPSVGVAFGSTIPVSGSAATQAVRCRAYGDAGVREVASPAAARAFDDRGATHRDRQVPLRRREHHLGRLLDEAQIGIADDLLVTEDEGEFGPRRHARLLEAHAARHDLEGRRRELLVLVHVVELRRREPVLEVGDVRGGLRRRSSGARARSARGPPARSRRSGRGRA